MLFFLLNVNLLYNQRRVKAGNKLFRTATKNSTICRLPLHTNLQTNLTKFVAECGHTTLYQFLKKAQAKLSLFSTILKIDNFHL